VTFRLAHYARTLARPGGIRYLARRTGEVAHAIPGLLAKRIREVVSAIGRLAKRTEALFELVENEDELLIPRIRVRALVCRLLYAKHSPIDVMCIGDIADYVATPPNLIRRFDVADRSQDGTRHDYNIGIPEGLSVDRFSILIIYATAGLLSTWNRMEEDVDRFFRDGYQQVIIVLPTDRFRPLDFAGHSYLLSVLLSDFPARKFSTKLGVYVFPGPHHARERPFFRAVRIQVEDLWQKAKRSGLWICGVGVPSPTHFSTLIISVEPRQSAANKYPNARLAST
jgi:hypothetical protein